MTTKKQRLEAARRREVKKATKSAKGARAAVRDVQFDKAIKAVIKEKKRKSRAKEVREANKSARSARVHLNVLKGSAKRKANRNIRKGMRIMGSKKMTGGSPGTRRIFAEGSEAHKVATKAAKKRRLNPRKPKPAPKPRKSPPQKPSIAKNVLKGAGKVAKTIAKRSPIIGGIASLADYKDAYKRVAKHDQKKYDAMRARAKNAKKKK
jgi:hypothetical protein